MVMDFAVGVVVRHQVRYRYLLVEELKSDGLSLNTNSKSKKAQNYLKILKKDRSIMDLLYVPQFNMVNVIMGDGLMES